MTNVPELLAKIQQVHAATTGWCPLQKAYELAMIVLTMRPTTTVEVGVYAGKSFLPMAIAAEAVGHGELIAIDPWTAKAGTEGYTGANKDWWGKLDYTAIYSGFTNSLRDLGLENRVKIQRCRSDDAQVPTSIDLLGLDGQHTEQAVRDVKRFCPNVRIGGLVVIDDLGWNNDGDLPLVRAVEHLLSMGFVELSRTKLETGEEWGVFQRVGKKPGRKAKKK